ncbi:MAG: PqqD family protein [Lachnospiraceae bacterium]|nr:PqqD family protein [Lachnospiraceae bacterium]MBQ3665576.1 PqqD family protein [Lachnospiraceae bacterium]
MKLKKNFIYHNTGEEIVLVATGEAKFSGIVKGNKTVGFIFECLKNDTTEQEIVAKMRDQYDAADHVIEKDVANVIEKLRQIGAIDE